MSVASLAPERVRVLRARIRIVVAITITWNMIEAVVAPDHCCDHSPASTD